MFVFVFAHFFDIPQIVHAELGLEAETLHENQKFGHLLWREYFSQPLKTRLDTFLLD